MMNIISSEKNLPVNTWLLFHHSFSCSQLSEAGKWFSYCCCSVARSCPTLCEPMDWSMPGFPVLHYLPEFAQTHVPWVDDDIQPSHPLSSPSPPAFNISPASGSFPMTQLFASGGQTTGASASALVLPMNIQGSFPLGLTGIPVVQGTLKSLLSTTVQKH